MVHFDPNLAIELELEQILADPAFQRAPTKTALLRYLARRTMADANAKITQYDIATEGLGKSDDFDSQAESYVRVQVSRLKDALRSYYTRNSPVREGCLHMKANDYRLHVASIDIAYPRLASRLKERFSIRRLRKSSDEDADDIYDDREDANRDEAYAERAETSISTAPPSTPLPPAQAAGGFGGFKPRMWMTAVAGLLVVGLALWTFARPDANADAGSGLVTPPYISYTVETVGFGSEDESLQRLRDEIEAETGDHLVKSLVAHASFPAPGHTADYELSIRLNSDQTGSIADIRLIDRAGQVVYQTERALPADLQRASELMEQELVALTSPPGRIARIVAARMGDTPRSDFECFLAAEFQRSEGQSVRDILGECARAYPNSEYYPYLIGRELFIKFQSEAVTGRTFAEDSPQWLEMGEMLERYPDNSYLAAVAAKVLMANGQCDEARRFQEQALYRGRTFPALELAMLVDELGCSDGEESLAEMEDRLEVILAANPEPEGMLAAYALMAILALDRPDLLELVENDSFSRPDNPIAVGNAQVHAAMENGAEPPNPAYITAMVFNDRSVAKILRTIDSARSRSAAAGRTAP